MTVDLEELVRRRCEPCFDRPIERIGGRRPWNGLHGGDGCGGGIVDWHHIGLGRRFTGTRVLVLVRDLHVRVVAEEEVVLLRELTPGSHAGTTSPRSD